MQTAGPPGRGLLQRQITLQAAPGSGQPRPTSCLGGSGQPCRAGFRPGHVRDLSHASEDGRHAHLNGQTRWNRRLWRRLARAAEAVAGRPVGRPLPGSAEPPRAARRALRTRRSRAGALPRGGLDPAGPPTARGLATDPAAARAFCLLLPEPHQAALVLQQGQSALPGQRPSSAPAPPQGAPGGSGQLGTPSQRGRPNGRPAARSLLMGVPSRPEPPGAP